MHVYSKIEQKAQSFYKLPLSFPTLQALLNCLGSLARDGVTILCVCFWTAEFCSSIPLFFANSTLS